MYLFKEEKKVKINQREASKFIGIAEQTLSKILNKKIACRKALAYYITKYLDENAEIEDYFERIN